MSTMIGFAVILAIGIFIENTEVALLYLFCIVPIRMYTGRYHANTYLLCNIVFGAVFI